MTLKLLKNREKLLATTLCGTNISVVTNSTLITSLFIYLFGEAGEIYAIFILVPLLLIFGEIIPKTIFQQRAIKIAPWVSQPIWLASYIFYPLIFCITKITSSIFFFTGTKKSGDTPFVTREELRLIIKMSKKGSDFKMCGVSRDILFRSSLHRQATILDAPSSGIHASSIRTRVP